MIPDEHLPPEFREFILKELGPRPSDWNMIDIYLDLQSKLRHAEYAEQLFQECFRYDLAKQTAFATWMAVKEQK